MKLSFKNIFVVGIGLIGGSILKAIKVSNIPLAVYGLDLDEDVTRSANNLGLINNPYNHIEKMSEESLVIFSVPSLSIEPAFKLIEEAVSYEQVTFTDTFSSKTKLIEYLKENKRGADEFIMSHPIAGSEKSGLSNYNSLLFKEKLVVLSALNKDKDNKKLNKVKSFWELLGSKVSIMNSDEHDKVFSKTSHLPHVIAFVLMDFLEKELGNKIFDYSGGSLESYTRIASSDPAMWKDVIISNKDEVSNAINGFKSLLEEFSYLMEKGDEKSILEYLKGIKGSRDDLIKEDT